MNKKQLIEKMAQKASLSKADAERALDAFVGAISEELAACGDVQLTGVLSLKVDVRPAREGRNPKTGEKIKIPAKKIIKCKAGKQLTDLLQ